MRCRRIRVYYQIKDRIKVIKGQYAGATAIIIKCLFENDDFYLARIINTDTEIIISHLEIELFTG